MPEDVSLDAFASSEESDADDAEAVEKVDAEENDETETTADADAEIDSDAETGDPERPAVEPAVSTYAWSPDGDACADCGESVAERWRAEGQRSGDLVCEDCKEW